MAELADALDLGSSAREGVGVQVSPGARRISEMRTRFSDLVFPIGEIRLVVGGGHHHVEGRITRIYSCLIQSKHCQLAAGVF